MGGISSRGPPCMCQGIKESYVFSQLSLWGAAFQDGKREASAFGGLTLGGCFTTPRRYTNVVAIMGPV